MISLKGLAFSAEVNFAAHIHGESLDSTKWLNSKSYK